MDSLQRREPFFVRKERRPGRKEAGRIPHRTERFSEPSTGMARRRVEREARNE